VSLNFTFFAAGYPQKRSEEMEQQDIEERA
jgi:hypothetical protein